MKQTDRLPEGIFVVAIKSGGIRFITKHSDCDCFEDDGKVSNQKPSDRCYFKNYKPLIDDNSK